MNTKQEGVMPLPFEGAQKNMNYDVEIQMGKTKCIRRKAYYKTFFLIFMNKIYANFY